MVSVCNDVSCVLVCHGVYWFVMVCHSVYWSVMVCHDVYWCVMVCTVVMVYHVVLWCLIVCHGVSCVARYCSHTVHYKSGHNPNMHTFLCFIYQALQQFHMYAGTHNQGEKGEKWRNGAGESMERQEAAGTDRMYGRCRNRKCPEGCRGRDRNMSPNV